MTKSRKPAAITFRNVTIDGRTFRQNAETGVRIVKSEPDNGDGTYYSVLAPTRNGEEFDHIIAERTLHAAREWATERVEMVREEIEMAHADAIYADVTETDRVAAAVSTGIADIEASGEHLTHPASRVVKALLVGARHSALRGFIQVGRDRLARAKRILDGTETVPTDAEADAEAAKFNARNPEGTRVELTTGQRYGLRARITNRPAVVYAEHNRAAVMVKVDGRGYCNEWCDSLRPLVGRDRP